MAKYKNITDNDINVLGISRPKGEIFEGDEKNQELRNLVYHKYLEQIKEDKPKVEVKKESKAK